MNGAEAEAALFRARLAEARAMLEKTIGDPSLLHVRVDVDETGAARAVRIDSYIAVR